MKLIDTPGIKGFGVVDMQAEEIGNYFPEFLSLKSECKFHNCLHQREPQCAVIQAFEEGNIAESRYPSCLYSSRLVAACLLESLFLSAPKTNGK